VMHVPHVFVISLVT